MRGGRRRRVLRTVCVALLVFAAVEGQARGSTGARVGEATAQGRLAQIVEHGDSIFVVTRQGSLMVFDRSTFGGTDEAHSESSERVERLETCGKDGEDLLFIFEGGRVGVMNSRESFRRNKERFFKSLRPISETRDMAVSVVKRHPHRALRQNLLVSVVDKGCPAQGRGGGVLTLQQYKKCLSALYYTPNCGRDWFHVSDDIVDFEWRAAVVDETKGNAYFGLLRVPEMGVFLQVGKEFDGTEAVLRSDLLEREHPKSDRDKTLHTSIYEMRATGSFLNIWAESPESQFVAMFSSLDCGRTFRRALISGGLVPRSSLTMQLSRQRIALAAGDGAGPYSARNLYTSDDLGAFFTESLGSIITSDFVQVRGLPSTLVARVAPNVHEDNPGKHESMLSFDAGAQWIRFVANESAFPRIHLYDVDVDKQAYNPLPDGSRLLLIGPADIDSTHYPTVYSLDDLPGYIIANAMLTKPSKDASTLSTDEGLFGGTGTWLSIDGGVSWSHIRSGTNIYEFGDHGSLIVLAPKYEMTKEVWYSWNAGMTWKSISIPAMFVENIVNLDLGKSDKFIVHGDGVNEKAFSYSATKLCYLDFGRLNVRSCRGQESKSLRKCEELGTEESASEPSSILGHFQLESDFCLYNPTHATGACILGEEIQFVRRRRGSDCNVPDSFRPAPVKVRNCPCSRSDYECDFNFEPDGAGKCLPMKSNSGFVRPGACSPITGQRSEGYRLLAGNSCLLQGGLDLTPRRCGLFFGLMSARYGVFATLLRCLSWLVKLSIVIFLMLLCYFTLVGHFRHGQVSGRVAHISLLGDSCTACSAQKGFVTAQSLTPTFLRSGIRAQLAVLRGTKVRVLVAFCPRQTSISCHI
mmetsp:Transcript_1614/g.4843  ORF Transcript_1614/g.4843 Transcript_1614/m.4843 type:complete len:863 (-) Transcript_1614:1187-3775(-)